MMLQQHFVKYQNSRDNYSKHVIRETDGGVPPGLKVFLAVMWLFYKKKKYTERQGKVSNQVNSLTSQMKALENNESLTILNMILS